MTQKGKLFKGQQKKKTIPPSRHGKITQTRKGKRVIKPSKVTGDMDADRVEFLLHKGMGQVEKQQEITKFINHCNEVKAATAANKEGGQLSIVKTPQESGSSAKQQ